MSRPLLNDSLSQEVVDYQQDESLFRELTDSIHDLKKYYERGYKSISRKTRIKNNPAEIIYRHTGFIIQLHLVKDGNAAVEIPKFGRNNPILPTLGSLFLETDDLDQLLNKYSGMLSTTIDVENAKVSGSLAEIKHNVYLGTKYLKKVNKKLRADHIAAILLHEIGHLFAYYLYMTRMVGVNVIGAEIAEKVRNEPNKQQRIEILNNVRDELHIEEINPEMVAEQDQNGELVFSLVVSNDQLLRVDNLLSSTNTWDYDETNFEAIANQFTSRLGAGASQVEALDYLYREGVISKVTTRSWTFKVIYDSFSAIIHILGTIGPYGPILILIYLINLFETDRSGWYDKPIDRLERLRRDTIATIKDPDQPIAVRERMQERYDRIESVIDKSIELKSFTTRLIETTIITSSRNKKRRQHIQRLEEILNNRAYVRANQLLLADLKNR